MAGAARFRTPGREKRRAVVLLLQQGLRRFSASGREQGRAVLLLQERSWCPWCFGQEGRRRRGDERHAGPGRVPCACAREKFVVTLSRRADSTDSREIFF